MKYWRINTDKNARKDIETCDLWYKHKMAFAGDYRREKGKNASVFKKMSIGDGVFMHHARSGIVGYGLVSKMWDEKSFQEDQRLLYVNEDYEYRIEVNWLKKYDRRNNPLTILDNLPYRNTYCEINLEKWNINAVFVKLLREDSIYEGKESVEINEIDSSLVEDAYYRVAPEYSKLIERCHNLLSNQFCKWLRENEFFNVQQEKSNIDVYFEKNNKKYFAELKICHQFEAIKYIREALAQLLQYNYYPGRSVANCWVIVLDEEPKARDIEFIKKLKSKLHLPLSLCWKSDIKFEFPIGLKLNCSTDA